MHRFLSAPSTLLLKMKVTAHLGVLCAHLVLSLLSRGVHGVTWMHLLPQYVVEPLLTC